MDAHHFAQFHERTGYRVIDSNSGYWYEANRYVFLNIPPHLLIEPTLEELEELFVRHRILGVKFSSTKGPGRRGALYTIRDKAYDLHSLDRRFRSCVKKARMQLDVQEIDFDDLRKLGMPLNLKTLERHRRRDRTFQDPKSWNRLCNAGKATPGAGVWGAFVDGSLAAYVIYFLTDRTCHLLFQMSREDLWEHHPNHTLFFIAQKEMINRDEIDVITCGLEPLVRLEGLDRFKQHIGYRKEPVRYRVALRPAARTVLCNRGVEALLGLGERLPWSKHTIRRTRAILEIAGVSGAC